MTFSLGYLASAFMFLAALCLPLIGWRLGASPVATFRIAYVLTRPAGASFADYFGMPKDISGFGLGHGPVSAVLIAAVAAGIWFLRASGKDAQRPPAMTAELTPDHYSGAGFGGHGLSGDRQ